jgi:hypothetical protein
MHGCLALVEHMLGEDSKNTAVGGLSAGGAQTPMFARMDGKEHLHAARHALGLHLPFTSRHSLLILVVPRRSAVPLARCVAPTVVRLWAPTTIKTVQGG